MAGSLGVPDFLYNILTTVLGFDCTDMVVLATNSNGCKAPTIQFGSCKVLDKVIQV